MDDHGVARDAALVGVGAEGERDSSDLQARVVVRRRGFALVGTCGDPSREDAAPHGRIDPRRGSSAALVDDDRVALDAAGGVNFADVEGAAFFSRRPG